MAFFLVNFSYFCFNLAVVSFYLALLQFENGASKTPKKKLAAGFWRFSFLIWRHIFECYLVEKNSKNRKQSSMIKIY